MKTIEEVVLYMNSNGFKDSRFDPEKTMEPVIGELSEGEEILFATGLTGMNGYKGEVSELIVSLALTDRRLIFAGIKNTFFKTGTVIRDIPVGSLKCVRKTGVSNNVRSFDIEYDEGTLRAFLWNVPEETIDDICDRMQIILKEKREEMQQ